MSLVVHIQRGLVDVHNIMVDTHDMLRDTHDAVVDTQSMLRDIHEVVVGGGDPSHQNQSVGVIYYPLQPDAYDVLDSTQVSGADNYGIHSLTLL